MVFQTIKMKKTIAKDILFGTAVGDALGVPVEFKSRSYCSETPVRDMIGLGTHNQPTGTWSDDSSLTFCLADSLCGGYDIKDIVNKFVKWHDEGLWTPYGDVFDIGNTTRKAIQNLKNGVEPVMAGEANETSNGNGSLMRILPLMTHINGLSTKERFKAIREVSSITHRHQRSILGCILLLEYARNLQYDDPKISLRVMSMNFHNELYDYPELQTEMVHFERLFDGMTYSEHQSLMKTDIDAYKKIDFWEASMPSLASAKIDDIRSTGYVVDTLEASIWCLITTNSFEEAVLRAVNLGGDTDTGAVTGALAAIYYGYEAIPQKWIVLLARKEDIHELAARLDQYYLKKYFNHRCPICSTALEVFERYPRYVCPDCADLAADAVGRRLDFYNLGASGGYGAEYLDTHTEYMSHECYIKGIRCWADEARFGGIVIQKMDDSTNF